MTFQINPCKIPTILEIPGLRTGHTSRSWISSCKDSRAELRAVANRIPRDRAEQARHSLHSWHKETKSPLGEQTNSSVSAISNSSHSSSDRLCKSHRLPLFGNSSCATFATAQDVLPPFHQLWTLLYYSLNPKIIARSFLLWSLNFSYQNSNIYLFASLSSNHKEKQNTTGKADMRHFHLSPTKGLPIFI